MYNLFHHFNGGLRSNPLFVNCFSKTTGAACPGFPTYVSLGGGGLLPFGTGADNFATARQNQGYLDRTTGRYYVAGASITNDALGVLCIDLVAQTGCGWLPLQPGYGSNGSGTNIYPYVQNGAFANGEYYALTRSGRVICARIVDMTACPGQGSGPDFGYQVGLPSPTPSGTFPSWGSTIHQIGGLVIVTMPTADPAGNVRVSCFDPATHSVCAGWPATAFALPHSTSGNYASGALPTLSAAGVPTGFCININNGANDAGTTLFWDCFDLTGKLVANPPNFPGSNFGFSKQGLAEYTTYQSRVYYPSQQRTTSDRYVCYDFATQAPCTGTFPVQPTNHPGVNGVPGALLAYSLVSDPDVPTCIWELGDVGQYFQFDAVTGLKCNDTGTTARVELAPQFCDGGTGHVQGYGTVEIGGLTPADARSGTVSVLAADNATPIPGFSNLPFDRTTYDISAISYPTYLGLDTSKIFVRLSLEGVSTGPWENGGSPTVTVTYRGDGPQMCYQTQLPQDCALVGTTVSNTATGTLGGTALTPATATVTAVAASGTCVPTIVTTPTATATLPAGTLVDQARLSGFQPPLQQPDGTPDTVTFSLYGPSTTASCTGTAVSTSTVDILPDGTATSATFTPTQAGSFWWVAKFNGDPHNPAVSSACGDEHSVVGPASPSLVTAATPTASLPGAAVSDTAVLSGVTSTAGGTIVFQLYGPSAAAACVTPIFTSAAFTVSGPGPYGPAAHTVTTAGTYWWTAAYSGDANNQAVASACGQEQSVVAPAGAAIVTEATPTASLPAGVVSDSATLSGVTADGGRHNYLQTVRPVGYSGLRRHGGVHFDARPGQRTRSVRSGDHDGQPGRHLLVDRHLQRRCQQPRRVVALRPGAVGRRDGQPLDRDPLDVREGVIGAGV